MIRKGLIGLGLALISVIVVLVLFEAGLRLTPYRNLLIFSRSHVPPYYYRTDPAMGYDIKENFPRTDIFLGDGVRYTIWSNGIGCFDTPYKGEKDFVLLVGDSFTHAFAPFEDKWGTQMESLTGMRVLKCGVSGFGTKQAALKAESTCARVGHTPQLLVVGYTMNDFMDDYLFPQYSVTEGYFYIAKRLADPVKGNIATRIRTRAPMSARIWLKQHSITYNLWERTAARFSAPAGEQVIKTETPEGNCSSPSACPQPWLADAWQSHLSRIRSFGAAQRLGGCPVLFVLIPVRSQVYPFLKAESDPSLDKKYAMLLDEFRKSGVNYLDLLPQLTARADKTPRKALDAKKDLYWPVDGHWSAKGNHLAGLLVSEYILDKNLIHIPDRDARLTAIRQKLAAFR